MEKKNNPIDFAKYKKTGKIFYVDEVSEEPIDDTDFTKEMNEMAAVSAMSTDELFMEIGLIINMGESPKGLSLGMLATELSSRLVLMESICYLASKIDNKS